jgi:hypothetical protein
MCPAIQDRSAAMLTTCVRPRFEAHEIGTCIRTLKVYPCGGYLTVRRTLV